VTISAWAWSRRLPPFKSTLISRRFWSWLTSRKTRVGSAPKCGLPPSPRIRVGAPPADGTRKMPVWPDHWFEVSPCPPESS